MGGGIPLDAGDLRGDATGDFGRDDGTRQVAPDLAYVRLAIVNAAFFGRAGAGDRGWVLIDTGIAGTSALIEAAAAARFGATSRPAAIVLTHGHADHVGNAAALAARWDAPVYAHTLEIPYLDGNAAYPPPDPSVGGGLVALLSPLFPPGPVDLRPRLRPLPPDGSVPAMPGWRWLHTPGHSAGHVSLWREKDRALLAGDAFVTTRQESALAVLTQALGLYGPPMFYTIDWAAARDSVWKLAALRPALAITGHGLAVGGEGLRGALDRLATDFDRLALPAGGRYLARPARVAEGTAYL